ncbi:MAG: quinolinate synthase NadA, partial [Clostridia bacterium]|nr:quinolinate synthase NadA [Clostridia bacterium]
QMSKEYIESIKKTYPDYTVVAYINTTAELKTICDVCVTSASALKIVKNIPNDKILFIPDCNLGSYVAKNVPEKTFKLLHGGCPIHGKITGEEAREAKRLHPKAEFLVHPECVPQVVAQADFIGSTTAIMNYAKQSDAKEFIIGTEIAIAEYLQFECPDKKFYPLSSKLICPDMKATTLVDVYNILKGDGGEEIVLPEDTIKKARACIDKMIELGG